ncbi:unnamed protein product [Ceratitis capitata]|uniref:(Mediterranean fruit fly) hypothetical protein n=1 Tax=Ceratitis capitata TaxID=7213 RepID=A0A811U9L2_CERCA|nr:unnamed protein product [Ceratitis capitata]
MVNRSKRLTGNTSWHLVARSRSGSPFAGRHSAHVNVALIFASAFATDWFIVSILGVLGLKVLFNFVGRILGPRGMTAKQLEQETGCKIMVRGKGSMRDKKKEDANRGKPNWEHLSDDLHVLITVEDTENRAKVKLAQAVAEVQKLLVPQAEGEDELKKRQLMELAIINGTYRDTSAKNAIPACEEDWRRVIAASAESRLLTPALPGLAPQIRAPQATTLGAPLILSQRMTVPTTAASILSGQAAPAAFENPAHGMIFAPYGDYANYAALAAGNPLLTEYTDHSVGRYLHAGSVF